MTGELERSLFHLVSAHCLRYGDPPTHIIVREPEPHADETFCGIPVLYSVKEPHQTIEAVRADLPVGRAKL